MTRYARTLRFSALGAAALLVALAAVGGRAQAQLATSVQCPVPCVDTSEIVPGAINATVIANGTIGPNKLIPGSMNTATIATDAIRSNKILDGAVQHVDLAPDAVFQQIIHVRANPTNQPGNCNALNAALASIPVHNADNPWLIKLEPGIYNCGGTTTTTGPLVQMLSFVSIEGSGVLPTVIRGRVNSAVNGVLSGATGAELRFLRVENLGGTINTTIAIDDGGSSSFRLTHVLAIGGFGSTTSTGILVTGTPVLTNVTAVGNSTCAPCGDAIGIHIDGDSAAPQLVNVRATAAAQTAQDSVGLLNENRVTARNSVFVGVTAAVDGGVGGVEHNLISTQLDGGRAGSGNFRCVGAYDDLFAALDAACL